MCFFSSFSSSCFFLPLALLCRDRCVAFLTTDMRFIGELYLRKCIAPSVLKAVVTSLVFGDAGDPNHYPDEHFIECFTELLTTIGQPPTALNPHLQSAISQLLPLDVSLDRGGKPPCSLFLHSSNRLFFEQFSG